MKMFVILLAAIATLALVFLPPALAIIIIVIVIGAGVVVFLKNK